MKSEVFSTPDAISHLEPIAFQEANRRVLAKAIAEFSHELLLEPTRELDDRKGETYQLRAGDATYRFRATRLSLDYLCVEASSIEYRRAGRPEPLSATRFVLEFAERLCVDAQVLPSYLEELSATLYAYAYKLSRPGYDAAELVHADFQRLEAAMMDGHPCFVANSGRVGFSAFDYVRYAPEAARGVALVWLAARRERTDFACMRGFSYDALIEEELSSEERAAFTRRLEEQGLSPEEYYYLPVHPWQWENRVAQGFAADLASGSLVFLGASSARYRPQQSIRTLFNETFPQKHYVKTALSIVNMGFSRGLSAAIAESAAAVNTWASQLVQNEPYLQSCGFELLSEVAWIGFRHRGYERATDRRVDPRKEMLAALWRQSPLTRLRAGERLMTMAGLFYVDRNGTSLLLELVRASRLGLDAWLRSCLTAYLKPQLHCFYSHRLVFTPHAENVILVLEGDVVTRTLIKDIAEDVGVLNPSEELAPALRRIALRVPEEVMTLSIFTDVFDCLFRQLSGLLWQHARYPELKFWRLVADCIREYEEEHPELAQLFRRYDLFAPTFARNCLNRLQLRNNQLMVDLNAADPVTSLQFHGTLENPVARFSPRQKRLQDGGSDAVV